MKILLILSLALLTGCAGNSIIPSVSPDEGAEKNSFGCLQGMYSGRWANGNFQGKRLRLPEGFDVTTVTPEQLKALADILCD